ncbi:hypothetical protein PoB_001326800 [Plakobranchus ocellatus]|uniref:Uncharacterized protein n=1 Tax=Plakobranchus ocellatus TaxID=259542 RepID=A0AAV3YW52_9GAST|nr:hypothetical protein PoB_001326800 [Plakobranchus ocellatus]
MVQPLVSVYHQSKIVRSRAHRSSVRPGRRVVGLKPATEGSDGSWRGGGWYIASPQQGDLKLSGPPSGQGAGDVARTCDRRVLVDLRADSPATEPPTTPSISEATLEMKTFTDDDLI